MGSLIVLVPIGLIICAIGILNMMGNISSLHSYHRNNVKPEDVKPFGKMVGLGTLICGISVLVFAGFLVASILLNSEALGAVGSGVMIAIMCVGIFVTLFAIKKYNGDIFG